MNEDCRRVFLTEMGLNYRRIQTRSTSRRIYELGVISSRTEGIVDFRLSFKGTLQNW